MPNERPRRADSLLGGGNNQETNPADQTRFIGEDINPPGKPEKGRGRNKKPPTNKTSTGTNKQQKEAAETLRILAKEMAEAETRKQQPPPPPPKPPDKTKGLGKSERLHFS